MNQIRPLDGFRGLAALMVMWFHYFQVSHHSGDSPLAHSFQRFMNIGQGGVDLFFVLSGFLITRILLSTKGDSKYLRRFYARRSLRIFPLYFAFLVLFLLTASWLNGGTPLWSEHWYFWAFSQNIPQALGWPVNGPVHYWSLAVEEQFYLVWPFLVLALSKKWLVRVSVVLFVLPFVLRIILIPQGVDVYFLTITRTDGLALGALLALFEPGIVAGGAKYAHRFRVGLLIAVPLLAMGFVVFGGQMHFGFRTVKFTLISLCGALMVGLLLTANENSRFRRFFDNRFMVFTGRISFGLYVYQTLCFGIFDKLFQHYDSLLRLPVAFALVYLIAWMSFRWFETPILGLKRHFSYDKPKPVPQQPSVVTEIAPVAGRDPECAT